MKVHLILFLMVFVSLSSLTSALQLREQLHEITLHDLYISDDSLQCQKHMLVYVGVKNEGTAEERVYAELLSPKLQVQSFSSPLLIKPGTRQHISIPLVFAEEPQGTFEFEARLYTTGDGIKRTFKTFTFLGCPTAKVTSLIPEQQHPPKLIPPPKPQPQSPDPLLLITSILAILVATLALITLFRLHTKA